MSRGQRQRLKALLRHFHLDVFAPTHQVTTLKQQFGGVGQFESVEDGVVCTNTTEVIVERITTLLNNGRLRTDSQFNGKIWLCLLGDNGGDGLAKGTKIGMTIANVDFSNSFRNFTLLAFFRESDNRQQLQRHLQPLLTDLDTLLREKQLEIGENTIQLEM